MRYKRAFAAALAVFLCFSPIWAQKAEMTISLNEPFFDALLDSVFQNVDPLEFSIAKANKSQWVPERNVALTSGLQAGAKTDCRESIRILKEMNGVRTAVRFREGKIYVPLAFSGSYAPPFVGCVDFAGWAETNIDLEFDREGQRLIGRARVLNVNLSGTGGVGGSVIAKLIQNSIDKKLNPIEIVRLDKLSFAVPVQNAGGVRMKAVGVRTEIVNASLNVVVSYQFVKL